MGVLYLENKDCENIFSDERSQILSLLSSQLAISFENTRLYENLSRKTQELEEKNKQLAHTDKIKDQFMANMVTNCCTSH